VSEIIYDEVGNEIKNIIWRWTPEKTLYDEKDPRRFDDVAEEYLITRNVKANSGIICFAKYRGEWQANPFSTRPIITKLLSEIGINIPLPKNVFDE